MITIWDIYSQVMEVSSAQKIPISALATSDREEIVDKITSKYANGTHLWPLWDSIDDYVSVGNEDAWEWVDEFIGQQKTVLFFNPQDERHAFLLNSGDDVVKVLNGIFNVEFYLCDKAASFLLGFHHNGVLVACGKAKNWLRKYKVPEYDWLMR